MCYSKVLLVTLTQRSVKKVLFFFAPEQRHRLLEPEWYLVAKLVCMCTASLPAVDFFFFSRRKRVLEFFLSLFFFFSFYDVDPHFFFFAPFDISSLVTSSRLFGFT